MQSGTPRCAAVCAQSGAGGAPVGAKVGANVVPAVLSRECFRGPHTRRHTPDARSAVTEVRPMVINGWRPRGAAVPNSPELVWHVPVSGSHARRAHAQAPASAAVGRGSPPKPSSHRKRPSMLRKRSSARPGSRIPCTSPFLLLGRDAASVVMNAESRCQIWCAAPIDFVNDTGWHHRCGMRKASADQAGGLWTTSCSAWLKFTGPSLANWQLSALGNGAAYFRLGENWATQCIDGLWPNAAGRSNLLTGRSRFLCHRDRDQAQG